MAISVDGIVKDFYSNMLLEFDFNKLQKKSRFQLNMDSVQQAIITTLKNDLLDLFMLMENISRDTVFANRTFPGDIKCNAGMWIPTYSLSKGDFSPQEKLRRDEYDKRGEKDLYWKEVYTEAINRYSRFMKARPEFDIFNELYNNNSMNPSCTFCIFLRSVVNAIIEYDLDVDIHPAGSKVIDLNWINTSSVDCMHHLFMESSYDGRLEGWNVDISKWDTSNVKTMHCMFEKMTSFDCDISGWDVHQVVDFSYMFSQCKSFNCDLSKWDISASHNFRSMFAYCEKFNQDMSAWGKKFKQLKDVQMDISEMFYGCISLNIPIIGWELADVNMNHIFAECTGYSMDTLYNMIDTWTVRTTRIPGRAWNELTKCMYIFGTDRIPDWLSMPDWYIHNADAVWWHEGKDDEEYWNHWNNDIHPTLLDEQCISTTVRDYYDALYEFEFNKLAQNMKKSRQALALDTMEDAITVQWISSQFIVTDRFSMEQIIYDLVGPTNINVALWTPTSKNVSHDYKDEYMYISDYPNDKMKSAELAKIHTLLLNSLYKVAKRRDIINDVANLLNCNHLCTFYQFIRTLIYQVMHIEQHGNINDLEFVREDGTIDLNWINTTNITTLENLLSIDNILLSVFKQYIIKHNIDVSKWDTRNVTSLSCTFRGLESFNCDLSKWKVDKCESFYETFNGCHDFNQDLSAWNVLNAKTMKCMFMHCTNLNKDFSAWGLKFVNREINFRSMFKWCKNLNTPITGWKLVDPECPEMLYNTGYSMHTLYKMLATWDVKYVAHSDNPWTERGNVYHIYGNSNSQGPEVDFLRMPDWYRNSVHVVGNILTREEYRDWAANVYPTLPRLPK